MSAIFFFTKTALTQVEALLRKYWGEQYGICAFISIQFHPAQNVITKYKQISSYLWLPCDFSIDNVELLFITTNSLTQYPKHSD